MTINELREKRNQAWNAAKAFVETKRDKDGLLSEEDAKTYHHRGDRQGRAADHCGYRESLRLSDV